MNSHTPPVPADAYRVLFEDATEAMLLIDRNDMVVDANAASMDLTGYTTEELTGLNLSELLIDGQHSGVSGHQPVSIACPAGNAQRPMKKKDGTVVAVTHMSRRLPDGGSSVIIHDVTKEQLLERQIRLAQYCMDCAEISIAIIDSTGCILHANKHARKLVNCSSQMIIGRMIHEVNAQLTPALWQEICAQLQSGRSGVFRIDNWQSDGNEISIAIRASLARFDGQDFYFLMARDTSPQQRTERALLESEQTLHAFYDNTLMGLYRSTPAGKILMVNNALLQLLGYASLEDMASRNLFHEGHEPSYDRKDFLKAMAEKGHVIGHEAQWKRSDGTVIWVREGARAVKDRNGAIEYFDCTVEDITERKLAELRLKASLEEKETLLKEVHHRVKNNLQIISSLLNLQASEIGDYTLFEMFKESQDRIRTLALVHEKLYQGNNLAQVNFLDYLQSVTLHLARSYQREGLSWDVEGDEVFLGVDQAIPCGLIVNELVSNAMKHAFVGRDHGTLLVSLRNLTDGKATLRVQDDGVGFPADKDFRAASSMGMVLIMALVEQLSARISLDRAGGTTFTLEFQPHP